MIECRGEKLCEGRNPGHEMKMRMKTLIGAATMALAFATQGCFVLKDVEDPNGDSTSDAGDAEGSSGSSGSGSGSGSSGSGGSTDAGDTGTATATSTDSGDPTATATATDDGDPTADGGTLSASETDGGTSADTGFIPEDELCFNTGGEWLPDTCGHWVCGYEPGCDAIVPGCDCGEGYTFAEGEGCVEDDLCAKAAEEVLCVETGGSWDPLACGHYECGIPNECEAVDPGCDCGSGRNFDPSAGCEEDVECPVTPLGEVCDPSTPTCGTGAACCYPCGVQGCDFICVEDDPSAPGECPPPPP